MVDDTHRSSSQWPPPAWHAPPSAEHVPLGQVSRPDPIGRACLVALIAAGLGWVLMLFGLMAESDTGHPDGLACTARRGAAYESCMYTSERNGLIMWAVASFLAMLGVIVLIRAWLRSRPHGSQRGLFGAAAVGAGLLLAAGVAVWVHGARGHMYADKLFYEESVGAGWWSIAMAVGFAAGAGVALVVPLPRAPAERATTQRSASEEGGPWG